MSILLKLDIIPSTVLCLSLVLSAGVSAKNLPEADPEFNGNIGKTYQVSEADSSLFASPMAPKDAPNILVVLLDDIGFAVSERFGGPVHTPTLTRLAKEGLSYNAFHTTALCSPTRASLLTGRNHHRASTGTIIELATGYPGYTGVIPKNTATIGQILQQHGYSTSWFGKNHNVASNVSSMVGPFQGRPNGLGFDYFYGFLGGEADQWYPNLLENQNPVTTTPTPEEGYNLTRDLADKAIGWMHSQNSIAPDRPFFLYFAPGAAHAPHQPPASYPEKYRGKFSKGWDKYREEALVRQKELGVVPEDTQLTPRPKQMPAWNSFDDQTRKMMERQMETYAGYVEYADVEVGRIIDAIGATGELDNTLIIYIFGDNGGSAEGSLIGSVSEVMNLNAIPPSTENNMRFYDEWGGPNTSPHMAVGWAWATSTPFQWTKQVASHLGGTRNGTVISWPRGIETKGELRTQFHHVNDIVPTILEVTGIPAPDEFNGIEQAPMDGISMAYTFTKNGAVAEGKKITQYFEMFGHRAIYHDGWMASAYHNRVPWKMSGTMPFEDDRWELFNLNEDFSQAVDLADKYPEKLAELQEKFDIEARSNNVYPLDDRFLERGQSTERPSFTAGRDKFVFYPGAIRLPESMAPNMKNRSHSITANVVIPEEGAEGVILAMGGGTAGFSLYMREGKLTYYYDWFKFDEYTITSDQAIPAGKQSLRMNFDYDGGGFGKGADVTLFLNDRQVGFGRLDKSVPNLFGVDAMDIGMDLAAPVHEAAYQAPYAFTGQIRDVTVELR